MISRRSWTTLLLAFAVVGLSSHDSCFGAEKDADDPNTEELFVRARKLSEENRKVGEALIRVLADKKRSSDERLEAAK